jgi:membrane-associated phospholipid phosphatase
MFLQSFFLKNRPNMDLFESDVGDTLLHSLLPDSSFPSDHAVVGMSIAVASLIR